MTDITCTEVCDGAEIENRPQNFSQLFSTANPTKIYSTDINGVPGWPSPDLQLVFADILSDFAKLSVKTDNKFSEK